MARIVFDLDGTLIDSNPTLLHAANALLAGLGRTPIDAETNAGFLGKGIKVLVERLLRTTGGVPGGDLAAHVAQFRAIYAADPLSDTEVFPGVHGALADLASAGHGLGVCTQKLNEPALVILRTLGLMPPVSAFTGGESLDVLKPDPRMLAHAAAQLPPGPLIYIGDSETDAETARRAAVPFLLFTEGYRTTPVEALPHAAAFDDFATLPDLVARQLETLASG